MASTTVRNFRTTPRKLACAEVFFKCLETFAGNGYGSMVDSVQGRRYNPLAANTGQYYDPQTGDGAAGSPLASVFWMENGVTPVNSVYPLNVTQVALESGRWPNLGQRKVILFGCGVFRVASMARIPFGGVSSTDPVGGNISISCATFHGPVKGSDGALMNAPSDGGLGLLCNTSLTGKSVALVGEYVPATTDGVTVTNGSFRIRVIDPDGNTLLADDAITPLDVTTVVTVVGDITPHLNNKTRFGGIDFYSIMLKTFTGALPANREAAYRWMFRHHAAGHREEPPHFVGYS